jgi:hypothetical protein
MNDWENPPLEPAPPPEQTPPVPEQYPFWNYLDFALFVSLAVPSFALAGLATGLFLWIRPAGSHARVIAILLLQFIGYLFWFASLYGLLKLKYDRPFWPSLAWRKPASGWLWSASIGILLAFAIGIVGVLIRTPDIPMPIKDLLGDRFSVALVGVFGVTLGPLCEELAFRGFLLPLLVRSLGAFWGIFLTALPFALLHGSEYAWEWRHILLILVAGLAFGWMRHRSGSTAAAALMHATYNLTQFIGFISQGK